MFVASGEDDYEKFVYKKLAEITLQEVETLLLSCIEKKKVTEPFSLEFMAVWSNQIACESHLVMNNYYESVHDIKNSHVSFRKKK